MERTFARNRSNYQGLTLCGSLCCSFPPPEGVATIAPNLPFMHVPQENRSGGDEL